MHGTEDETAPLSQSETLGAVLKSARVESQLVVVPCEIRSFYLEFKQIDLGLKVHTVTLPLRLQVNKTLVNN